MFETIRLSLAANRAIFDLISRGKLHPDKQKEMLSVAGSDLNREFGVGLLRMGGAKDRHAAAGAVFARIAGVAERTPTGSVTPTEWRNAARQALMNSGATETESHLMVAAIIRETGGAIPGDDDGDDEGHDALGPWGGNGGGPPVANSGMPKVSRKRP